VVGPLAEEAVLLLLATLQGNGGGTGGASSGASFSLRAPLSAHTVPLLGTFTLLG